MPRRSSPEQPDIVPRKWTSAEAINRAIEKLRRRIGELEGLDVREATLQNTSADDVALSNVRETIREVFGQNSPEFREHQNIQMWAGPMRVGMSKAEIVEGRERGRRQVIGVLNGLIARLEETREDMQVQDEPTPEGVFGYLHLHPRIADVAAHLFLDGYYWEAVFAASKALVNYVKERSGHHELDGAALMRTVFSRHEPILAFNDLANQTDHDEQEGMMHLFEGVVLAIRNPGGHTFPEGPVRRAAEYLSLVSLLAYRVQEAKRIKGK